MTRRLTAVAWTLAVIVTTASAAALDPSATTIIRDGFDDGGFTDGADPHDTTWNWTGGDAFLSVVEDGALDGQSNSRRVLKAEDVTERDEYLVASFDPVTLVAGQGLRFSGRVRLNQPPREGLSRFGVALMNSANLWSGDGYAVNVNLGRGEPDKPDTRLIREVGSQPANLNTSDVRLGDFLGNAGSVGTEPFLFVLEVRRLDEASVEIRFSLKDRQPAVVVDRSDGSAGSAVVRFQKALFRTDQADGATGGMFFFDDLVIERFELGK